MCDSGSLINTNMKLLNLQEEDIEKLIENLYNDIIGNNIEFNTPYGRKNMIYTDFTASSRGLNFVEEFISKQILPFYANVHTSIGFLAEQSENFRKEAKTIIRRYMNTDERDSIIFSGQGTTSCVNKLIKILNLKQYVDFYQKIKMFKEIYENFIRTLTKYDNEEILNIFIKVNETLFNEIKISFGSLFKISNFCYKNRWNSYDCTLCRMTFLSETQYNDHEITDIHQNNLKKLANSNSIFNTTIDVTNIKDLFKNIDNFEPVVYLSVYEHNSNSLPWRETNAKIVYIPLKNEDLDYSFLEKNLIINRNKIIKIGSFTAASNISGIYTDVDYLSYIMHKYQGIAFFDYATAAPYVKIDMNRKLDEKYREKLGLKNKIKEEVLCYKDGIIFSPHKLLGGPNTPGVLIIKQDVVRNLLIPSEPGGGVVLFVRKYRENYVKNIEAREESGTPDIIGSVRIGIILMIKERITHDFIINKEELIDKRAKERLLSIKNLYLIGNVKVPRIPIYSFVIKFNKKLLHYNFVAALLNDLFGIQSRGGCSCASVYGQQELGISEELSAKLEKLVCNGNEIFRPGYTRINLPYFYNENINDYVINAIDFISQNGWKYLPHYAYKVESGEFYNRLTETEKRKWLNQINFKNGEFVLPELIQKDRIVITNIELDKHFSDVVNLTANIKNLSKQFIGKSQFNNNIVFKDIDLRWFLLSDDIDETLYNEDDSKLVTNMIDLKLDNKFEIKFAHENNDKFVEEKNNHEDEIIENNTEIMEVSCFNMEMNVMENQEDKKFIFPEIPKKLAKLVGQAMIDHQMIKDGDKVLIGLSGGKDSMTLLFLLHYFKKKVPFKFDFAGVTVDPQSPDYDPSSMINFMKKLGVKYFYEKDPILERAKKTLQKDSFCSFCARMKRGIIYNCARREGFNVIALGQHLDDLAESFIMSSFHNGLLRTMKANYLIDQGDLRVIRPLIYCREKLFKEFVSSNKIPIIQENCPACFSGPTERHRVKVLLAQQENIYPNLFQSLLKAMTPLIKGQLEKNEETRPSRQETNREENKQETVLNPLPLSRETLLAGWHTINNLPTSQRIIVTSALRSSSNQNNPVVRLRRRRRTENENFSEEESINKEEEYVDFRTYPLNVNWNDIENDDTKAYEIFYLYGLFGVSIFNSFKKLLKLTEKNFLSCLLSFYLNNVEKSCVEGLKSIETFIECLPKLEIIKKIIIFEYISRNELIVIKIIMDIYEHYLFNINIYLSNDFIDDYYPLALLFYNNLSDEEIILIYDEISKNSQIKTALKTQLKSKLTRKKKKYLKRIEGLKSDKIRLCCGINQKSFCF